MLILLLMFLDTEVKLGIKVLNIAFAAVALIGCYFGIFFNIQLNNVINLPKNVDKARMIDLKTYPDYILNDVKASTYLTIALANSERYEDAFILSDKTSLSSSTQQYFAFLLPCVQVKMLSPAEFYQVPYRLPGFLQSHYDVTTAATYILISDILS